MADLSQIPPTACATTVDTTQVVSIPLLCHEIDTARMNLTSYSEIKAREDQLRVNYALAADSPDRLDQANPVHGLIQWNDKIHKAVERAWSTIDNSSYTQDRSAILAKAALFKHIHSNDIDERLIERLGTFQTLVPEQFQDRIAIAGGSVLDVLLNCGYHDYDIFFFGNHDPNQTLKEYLEYLQTTKHFYIDYGTRGRNVITINNELQIILRHYKSPSEIVTGFDVDCCGVVYAFGQIYLTERALHAISTRTNVVDVDRVSSSYEWRLAKYAEQRGFRIVVPNLNKDQVNWYKVLQNFVGNRSPTQSEHLTKLLYLELYVDKKGFLPQIFKQSDYQDKWCKSLLRCHHGSIIMFDEEKHPAQLAGYFTAKWQYLLELPAVYAGNTIIPIKPEFLTVNPGRQCTSSFQPIDKTWPEWFGDILNE